MRSREASNRLDRHALVMAFWIPTGFLTLAMLHYGFRAGDPLWVLAGFAPVLVGFAAHVIVNAVLGTSFTEREVGLALVLLLVAMISLGCAVLVLDGFVETFFLPVIGGTVGLVTAVIAYLVISLGPRRAFERFDIIRDNN